MFIVLLTVFALVDYVIIFCCIVNIVAKPAVGTAEIPEVIFDGETKQTTDNADMGFVCDDEEFNRSIEEQNSRIAVLSFNVNKILSNIDSIIERDKVNQEALSA
jgi:hypothetical protein